MLGLRNSHGSHDCCFVFLSTSSLPSTLMWPFTHIRRCPSRLSCVLGTIPDRALPRARSLIPPMVPWLSLATAVYLSYHASQILSTCASATAAYSRLLPLSPRVQLTCYHSCMTPSDGESFAILFSISLNSTWSPGPCLSALPAMCLGSGSCCASSPGCVLDPTQSLSDSPWRVSGVLNQRNHMYRAKYRSILKIQRFLDMW